MKIFFWVTLICISDVLYVSAAGTSNILLFLPSILSGNSVKGDPNTPPKYFSLPSVENTLNFGNVAIGNSVSQDLSIANKGGGGLKVDFIAFGGAHASDFRVESQKFPLIVQNGTPKSVAVICSPLETTGERQATLRLSCNDSDMPVMFEYPLSCTADPASPYCNLNTFFDITNNRSVGSPGKGYDSDRDRIKSQSCLNGDYSEIGAGSSEIKVDQISTYEELYEQITTKKKNGGKFSLVNIPFFYGLFLGLDFGKKKTSVFTSETRRKLLSESFAYQYELRVPNLEFQLDTSGDSLNGLGKGVVENQCQFRSTCGDQFVYQVERGASLYIALTFDFTSEFQKETFRKTSDGNFGISLSTADSVLVKLIQDQTGETARSYSSTKSYFILDIVYHENITWVCIKDGKGNEPAAGSSYWKKKKAVQDYAESITYSVGDFVDYQGELWGSIKDDNTGQTPGVDSAYWKKFEEPDESDKTDLASVEVNWSKFYDSLSEETKKATRLTIRAMQIGGNSTQLAQILGDGLSCSLVTEENASPCKEAITRIVQYTSSEGFIDGIQEKPAILDYIYRPYEEAGVFPGMISDLTDSIIQAREDLGEEFEQETGDKEDAEFKLNEFAAMLSEAEKTEMQILINTLEDNLDSMLDSASVCFSNLPDCETSVEETLSNLALYDQTLLELPAPILVENGQEFLFGVNSIQKYCELPPDYVLTGIGVSAGNKPSGSGWNSWNTVKLEGRRINANGTLGERETFCDGYISLWISVPDDKEYIMTGLGVARRWWSENDWGNVKYYSQAKALHGWYREFDPVNRKLKGETGNVIAGGASLEAKYLPDEQGVDLDHTIIKGVGMGLNDKHFGGMKIQTGEIR
jgi:hypothetical protein